MGSAWAFAFLVIYPAVQVPLLWLVVTRFDLRNDDGPRDPVGYGSRVRAAAGGSGVSERAGGNRHQESAAGHCANCGLLNDPVAGYCRHCLTGL